MKYIYLAIIFLGFLGNVQARESDDRICPKSFLKKVVIAPAIIQNGETGDSDCGEASEAKAAALPLTGEAALEYDRYLFVKAKAGDGRDSFFVVDIGASQSILAKKMVPASIALTKADGKGERAVEFAVPGAAGNVKELMIAKLPVLRVGNLTFTDQSFIVVDALPEFAGREVGGIIGLDLLQKGSNVSFSCTKTASTENKLVFSEKSTLKSAGRIEIPYSVESGQLYIFASIGKIEVDLILDTGAPESLINPGLAKSANIKTAEDFTLSLKDLDGNPIKAQKAVINQIKISNYALSKIFVTVADLPLFDQQGLDRTVLLGNSFFEKYGRVEIDFQEKLIRLSNR